MIKPDIITEFRPERKKWAFILIVSLVFTVAGILISLEGGILNFIFGCLGAVFGLIGTIVSLAAIFSKRMALRLTPEGFSFGTLKKRHAYSWTDIVSFGVGSVGQKRTCFTLRGDIPMDKKLRAINKAATGFDRFLPDTYGKEPMELARLMEDWRYRYTRFTQKD